MWSHLKQFFSPAIQAILNENNICLLHNQCDQIGLLLKSFGNFFFKTSPNIWQLFWLFWKTLYKWKLPWLLFGHFWDNIGLLFIPTSGQSVHIYSASCCQFKFYVYFSPKIVWHWILKSRKLTNGNKKNYQFSGPASTATSAFACLAASTATATGPSSASARRAGTECSATNVSSEFSVTRLSDFLTSW